MSIKWKKWRKYDLAFMYIYGENLTEYGCSFYELFDAIDKHLAHKKVHKEVRENKI